MGNKNQPRPARLIERLDIKTPLIGFYDAPDAAVFEPLVSPKEGQCIYAFYESWVEGKTLHLTADRCGCRGADHWMWGRKIRPRKEFLKFLADDEGLKVSRTLMGRWIDATKPYKAQHHHLLLGPINEHAWPFAKSITFILNPDQLSALAIGAQYHSAPVDPPPVIAPFGSGCSQFFPFKDLSIAQASIGATDIAMRQHLPPDVLTFTVTRPMFERLCGLDERSFLYKPFLERLKASRRGKL